MTTCAKGRKEYKTGCGILEEERGGGTSRFIRGILIDPGGGGKKNKVLTTR